MPRGRGEGGTPWGHPCVGGEPVERPHGEAVRVCGGQNAIDLLTKIVIEISRHRTRGGEGCTDIRDGSAVPVELHQSKKVDGVGVEGRQEGRHRPPVVCPPPRGRV